MYTLLSSWSEASGLLLLLLLGSATITRHHHDSPVMVIRSKSEEGREGGREGEERGHAEELLLLLLLCHYSTHSSHVPLSPHRPPLPLLLIRIRTTPPHGRGGIPSRMTTIKNYSQHLKGLFPKTRRGGGVAAGGRQQGQSYYYYYYYLATPLSFTFSLLLPIFPSSRDRNETTNSNPIINTHAHHTITTVQHPPLPSPSFSSH